MRMPIGLCASYSSARARHPPLMVIQADKSDTSFFDDNFKIASI